MTVIVVTTPSGSVKLTSINVNRAISVVQGATLWESDGVDHLKPKGGKTIRHDYLELDGSGYSSNDYTTEDKEKVGHLVVTGDGTESLMSDGSYRLVSPLTGFNNQDDVIVNYDSTNRTITLTGTFSATYQGEAVTELVTGWTSDPHADEAGTYFLYYDGTFHFNTVPWSFDSIQIAAVIFNGDKFGMRETHGNVMSADDHEEAHQTIGCYKTAGGDFTGYAPTSTTPADRRPLISETTIKDEDLRTVLPALSTEVYTRRYLTGSNTREFDTDQTDIISVTGAVPNWNQFTGGAWTQTAFTNNQYGAVFVAAIPVTADTASQKYRYIFVQPQTVSTTLTVIQGLTPSSLTLGDPTTLAQEYCFIGKIIVRYVGPSTNDWVITSVAKLEGTKISQVAITASPPSASAVSYTPTGGVSATDVQSAITELDSDMSEILSRRIEITQAIGRFGTQNIAPTADFFPFRAIYHTWDTARKNTGAVYGVTTNFGTGTQSILRSIDGGVSWTNMGTIATSAGELIEHIFVEPNYETIIVLKNMNTTLNNSYHVLTFNSSLVLQAELDIGVRMWHGSKNVDTCDKSGDFATRIIMFAEYDSSNNAETVRVWKSIDKGVTWAVVLEIDGNNGVVNSGVIRHFHCLQVDPITKHWWLASGDTDAQCNIWRSTDEGVTWDVIVTGSQAARTLGFVFETGYTYYAMDSPTASIPSKLYKINNSTLAITELASIPNGHAVYGTTKCFYPNGILLWTAYEVGSTVSNDVNVLFYDYRTGKLSVVYSFDRTDSGSVSFGISEASRYQDRETGYIWLHPTSTLYRTKYGYGGTSSQVSEILKAKLF